MKHRAAFRTAAAALALFIVAAQSFSAENAGMAKDLTATITLLGLPCGQVVSSKRLGENDYLAVCKDRNRYRVFVNAEGRVVAQKQ